MAQAGDSNPLILPELNLGLTFGALEISTILSSILFGVMTTQTYTYHRNFPHDSVWTKLIVDGLWLVELGQTICAIHFLYFWSVIGYGDPTVLTNAPSTLGLSVIFYGICVALVQGYFANRLRIITSSSPAAVRLVPVCVAVLISTRLGIIIVGAIESFEMPSYQHFVERWRTLIIASQITSVCTDLTIMITLVIYLRMNRADAYQGTVVIVDKLILWAIETGALTRQVVVSIMILVSLLTMQKTLIWLALLMILPKIFSNTLLANLNSRASLRAIDSTHVLATRESYFQARHSLSRSYRARDALPRFASPDVLEMNDDPNSTPKRYERDSGEVV